MKKSSLFTLLFLVLALTVMESCKSSAGTVAYDSAEATFASLQKAIAERDLAAYIACWHPDRLEREGMVSRIEADPQKNWDELSGIFKGPQRIAEKRCNEGGEPPKCKLEIEAPEADRGGIGAITMVKENGKWLMWSW